MKKIIIIFTIFLPLFNFAQIKEIWCIKDDFRITKIDSLKHVYLIWVTDTKENKILILEDKVEKKEKRKIKIKINETYSFILNSLTLNIGYLPTEQIAIYDKVIWKRDESDFLVFEAENLEGLYLNKN